MLIQTLFKTRYIYYNIINIIINILLLRTGAPPVCVSGLSEIRPERREFAGCRGVYFKGKVWRL